MSETNRASRKYNIAIFLLVIIIVILIILNITPTVIPIMPSSDVEKIGTEIPAVQVRRTAHPSLLKNARHACYRLIYQQFWH
jgi:hypothetical protein